MTTVTRAGEADGVIAYRRYQHRDLPGIIGLCEAEGWGSLPADHARAHRILTNPGVIAFVAVEGDDVVAFLYLLTDGELQAYLATLAVRADRRRQGVATTLIRKAFEVSGAERIDLLSDADDFYGSLVHRGWSGYRIYPPFRVTEGGSGSGV